MRADPDELLRGIRHLRKRAARGDLEWIRERYDSGKLRFLRKLMPDGGYARLGHELADDDVLGVRASLASIDDDLVAGSIDLDEPVRAAPATIDLTADEYDTRPRLVSITADDSYRPDASTSVFAPIDDYVYDDYTADTYRDDPVPFDDLSVDDDYAYDPLGLEPDDDRLLIIDDDFDPRRPTRVVEPVGRARTTRPPTGRTGTTTRGVGVGAGLRSKPNTQWLLIALGLVVLFALYLTQCTGSDDTRLKTTATTTSSTTVSPTTTPLAPTSLPTGATAPVAGGVTPTVPLTTPTVPLANAPFTIYFASNSSAIDAVGQAVIAQAIDRIKTTKPVRLIISGYASPDGNPTANNELSIRRANAVSDAITKGLGGSVPAITVDARVDAKPDPDPAKVRRVTITLSAT